MGARTVCRVTQHTTFNPQLSSRMKSAYELAMERLEKQAPTRTLTAAQKTEIAELEATAKAKIAEQGGEVRAGTPDAMATWLKDSTKRWGDIIREAGIKGE